MDAAAELCTIGVSYSNIPAKTGANGRQITWLLHFCFLPSLSMPPFPGLDWRVGLIFSTEYIGPRNTSGFAIWLNILAPQSKLWPYG